MRTIIQKTFFRFPDLGDLTASFKNKGFVKIKSLITNEGLDYLDNKMVNLLPEMKRRDFLMSQTGNTLRKMQVLSGHVMNNQKDILSIYKNQELKSTLSKITEKEICDCPELIENICITRLSKKGDTHGKHTDDYPIALIMAIKMPKKMDGGLVNVQLENGKSESIFLEKGDAYIMRTDKLLHSVTPLKTDSERIILNFTYSFNGMEIKPNGTAYKLFA